MSVVQREAPQAGPRDAMAPAITQLHDEGWCVLPDVLSPAESAEALRRLWLAADEYRRRGNATHIAYLDPNAANVRVFDLLDIDPVFRELIQHPLALQVVQSLLGDDFLISNFTANIARPGSASMNLHSDQALVVPEPWLQPWSINIIWCLTDVYADNGATLFIPRSQKLTRVAELGEEPASRLRPFEARAGSIVAMDGRIWHTSGANITADQDRALLFGYYSRSFLRGQVNWNAALSPSVQRELNPALRVLLGLDPRANVSVGRKLLDADLGGHSQRRTTSAPS